MLRAVVAGLVLAFAGSRANIARTILSCAGIVVGIGALITVVTASDVGERFATSYNEANFGRAATLQVDVFGGPADLAAYETDLRRAGAEAVAMLVYAESVYLRVGTEVLPEVSITITDAELGDIRKLEMARGRWFTDADQGSLAPVMVVNESLAQSLGEDATLQIGADRWLDVRVVGVLENTEMDSGWQSAYLLRGPASEALLPDFDSESGAVPVYSVLVDPADSDPEAYAERLNSASWRWDLRNASQDGFGPASAWRQDQTEIFEEMIGYLSLGLLGVLNVGLVTVRERRRGLATYRALGASSFTLFVAVVTEAVVVSVVAGLRE